MKVMEKEGQQGWGGGVGWSFSVLIASQFGTVSAGLFRPSWYTAQFINDTEEGDVAMLNP